MKLGKSSLVTPRTIRVRAFKDGCNDVRVLLDLSGCNSENTLYKMLDKWQKTPNLDKLGRVSDNL